MADDDPKSADLKSPDPKLPEQIVEVEHQNRDNVVEGLFASVKYLQSAHAETGFIKLRKSDRVTQVLLVVALLIVVAAQLMPSQRELCTILADGLMLVMLLSFLAVRFGVLRTLKPRQAVLAWQLILGSFLLGTYSPAFRCCPNKLLLQLGLGGAMPTIASEAWVFILMVGPTLKKGIGTGKTMVTLHCTLASPSGVPSYLSSFKIRLW